MEKRQRSGGRRQGMIAVRGARNSSSGHQLPAKGPGSSRPKLRLLLFAGLCAACLALGAGCAVLAAARTQTPAARTAGAPEFDAAAAEALQAQPYLVFRSTARDATYGKVALAARAAPDAARVVTPLDCDRVYFAAGKGLCLTADRGVFTTYRGYIFDAHFTPGFTFPLAGLPSRARLSPDGRFAAMTVFVSGHSYADSSFSTQTTLIDTDSGTMLG